MASFTERYHEATKYNPVSIDRLGSVNWGLQPPPFRSLECSNHSCCNCFAESLPFLKRFLSGQGLDSPAPPDVSQFGTPVSLAHLVYCAAGITAVNQTEKGPVYFRANPSAGALYPVELYFAVRDFQGIADGLYYFHPLLCGAVAVATGADWDSLADLFGDSVAVRASRLVFILTGVYERSAWRYKERCYRRMLLDAGCLLGNLQEQAWAQGLSTRLLGGFKDRELDAQLELAPGEVPLLAMAVDPHLQSIGPPSVQNASLPPHLAVQRLSQGSSDKLYWQQNVVERIDGDFTQPSLPPADVVEGTRIPLLPSPYLESELRRHLPRLGLLRRSSRHFFPDPVGPDSLGAVLQLAYQRWKVQNFAGDQLKSWLVVHDVEGLERGVYRYLPHEHALVPVRSGFLRDAMHEVALGQVLAEDCAALLVHTADLDQATSCFGDRAYRYLKADAGSVGESLNLYAGLYSLGTSGLAAYFDNMANKVLGLPPSEAVLYMTAVGRPLEFL